MQGEEDDRNNGKGRKKKNTKQDYIRGLMTRETSTLSHVAWDVIKMKYDHPAPTTSIKWKSPDAKIFTSRKTAWEYATVLSKQEVAIERNLKGVGASGKLLKEFVPTAKTAIEVGKLRFVRDGLWVVGQELGWQANREEELIAQEEELEEAAASKVYATGLQLYVAENRHQYREDHGTTLTQADKALRHQWRCLTLKEQEVWEDKVREQFSSDEESDSEDEASASNADGSGGDDEEESDESSVEYISPYQYFVQQRRHDYRHEQQMKLETDANGKKVNFTLAQADKELRQQWKEMTEEEQDNWIAKLEKMDEESEAKDEENKSDKNVEEQNETKEENKEGNEKEENKGDTAAAETDTTMKGEGSVDGKTSTSNETNTGEEVITESNSTATAMTAKSNDSEQIKEEPAVITESTSTTITMPAKSNDNEQIKEEPTNGIVFEEEKKSEEGDFDAKQPSTMSMDPSKKENNPESIPSNAIIPSPVKAPTTTTATKAKSKAKNASKAKNTTAKTSAAAAAKKSKKKSTRQVTPKYCLKPQQIQKCYDACMEHHETVMRTVKNRDLFRELADGFDVLRERGHGRFDMEIPAFDTPEYDFLNTFEKAPWMPIVHAILGNDVVLIHKGAFMSLPGADAQVYHQDGVHLTTQTQRPCHAINVFVPLVDLHTRNGPTEFVLGSHVLGHDGYDRDFLETPKPKAGTPVIFDYRLGHRGLGNSSQSCRPIVYCTYARASDGKEFRDSVNFSRKRYHKIGELSAKPLSREERRNKRKRSIESAKEKEELEKASKLSAMESVAKVETEETAVEDKSVVPKVEESKTSNGDANAVEKDEKVEVKEEIASLVQGVEAAGPLPL